MFERKSKKERAITLSAALGKGSCQTMVVLYSSNESPPHPLQLLVAGKFSALISQQWVDNNCR